MMNSNESKVSKIWGTVNMSQQKKEHTLNQLKDLLNVTFHHSIELI